MQGSGAKSLGQPGGWAIFAGVVLICLGSLNILWGLAAVIGDVNLSVGGEGVIISDFTAWGWATLIVGVIQVLVSFGLFAIKQWARVGGIIFAALAAIGQIGIVTAFPIWSLIVIALSILVVYNLSVHWDE